MNKHETDGGDERNAAGDDDGAGMRRQNRQQRHDHDHDHDHDHSAVEYSLDLGQESVGNFDKSVSRSSRILFREREVDAGTFRSLSMNSAVAVHDGDGGGVDGARSLDLSKDQTLETAQDGEPVVPRLPQPPFQLMRTHRFVRDVRPEVLLEILQKILQDLEVDVGFEKARAKVRPVCLCVLLLLAATCCWYEM